MKFNRNLLGLMQSGLAFIAIMFIAYIVYDTLISPYNIAISLIILLIGLRISYFTYKMVISRGYLDTMTGDNASFELDNLIPNSYDGISSCTPTELVSLFNSSLLNFKNGDVSIWGDSNGRKLSRKHNILDITYDSELKELNIVLDESSLVKIKEPKHILFCEKYLKIIKAKEILWQIENKNNTVMNFNYLYKNNEIATSSNEHWKTSNYDFGPGMNALYMQN